MQTDSSVVAGMAPEDDGAPGPMCSKCRKVPPRPQQRYCRTCHAADMRQRRVPPEIQEEMHRRAEARRARARLAMALKRGKIQKADCCQLCGAPPPVITRHLDPPTSGLYVWLCHKCHSISRSSAVARDLGPRLAEIAVARLEGHASKDTTASG